MRAVQTIVSGLLVSAGLLAAALASGPAQAQDEEFCRTYAYGAVEASKQHVANRCGGDMRIYSDKLEDHYNVCMSWGTEAMKYATQSANTRAQEFYNCKAQGAGVAAVDLGHTEYENNYPRPGDKFGFCSNYAFWATTQRRVAIQQNCGFSEASGRWGESFNTHRDWCMGLNFYDAGVMAGEINNRTNELVQCQTAATTGAGDPTIGFGAVTGKSVAECQSSMHNCEATALTFGAFSSRGIIASVCVPRFGICMNEASRPKGNTQKVKLTVEIFDLPEEPHTYLGDMREGTVVVVSECTNNNKCHVEGGGKVGWIYDGADYDTLDR